MRLVVIVSSYYTLILTIINIMVRVGVIETPSTAWKAVILPLNYTRRRGLHCNMLPEKQRSRQFSRGYFPVNAI